jgi:hypothetical protein
MMAVAMELCANLNLSLTHYDGLSLTHYDGSRYGVVRQSEY